MTAYIIRRLLILPIILFGVTLLVFAMLMLLDPRERAALYVSDIPHTSDALQKIIKKYGLNDPIYQQYWRWLVGRRDEETGELHGGILRGNFGWSHTAQMPVMEAILHKLSVTAELALWSFGPILGLGIWLGAQAAVHHNKFIDHASRVFAVVGWSIPTFVFGLLMLMIFYSGLGWLPPERLSEWAKRVVWDTAQFTQFTHMNTIDALLNLRLDIFVDAVRHIILPVFGLSYLSMAQVLRVMRSSMLETLRQDYITTARAKGLREKVVINRHARRNALIPVVTIGGLLFIALLNGVVITETIFNLPGIGRLFADAALSLDVVTVLGLVLFNGMIMILGNLVVDILYGLVDPRMRLE
ncbi:MAG: ABC transporter permease [Chloroflexota bacterium]|nr:ABC transporter permease [Chloroflexota bacterium]